MEQYSKNYKEQVKKNVKVEKNENSPHVSVVSIFTKKATDKTLQNHTATPTKGQEPEERHNLDGTGRQRTTPIHVHLNMFLVLQCSRGFGLHPTAQTDKMQGAKAREQKE